MAPATETGRPGALLFAGLANAGLHTPDGNARAVEAFTRGIPLLAAGGDRYDQGTAAAGLATTLQAMGRTQEARDAYVSALSLLDAAARGRERARALTGLSGVQLTLGEGAAARRYAEEALRLLTGPQDGPAQANAMVRLGQAGLTAQPPMALAAIQSLLDPDTVLLDYALGETRGFVFAVSAVGLNTYELPPRAMVIEAANALRTTISAPDDTERFVAASTALGEMLLGRVGRVIEDKRLIFVADAALQARVPFAALILPASAADHGKLLVEAHDVVVEPSAAALSALRRASAGRASAGQRRDLCRSGRVARRCALAACPA